MNTHGFRILRGEALAIPPCFIAAPDPRLRPVLSREIRVVRSFWIYCHEELRRLKRVTTLWGFLRAAVVHNQALLDGEAGTLEVPHPLAHAPASPHT